MAAHTPGPWIVDLEYRVDAEGNMDGADQVCAETGHTVAFISTGMREDEHHANAHLIAAAPEMYGALKSFTQAVADGEGLAPFYDAAHAAIAKAEGRQP
jgi:hypothetical protein